MFRITYPVLAAAGPPAGRPISPEPELYDAR